MAIRDAFREVMSQWVDIALRLEFSELEAIDRVVRSDGTPPQILLHTLELLYPALHDNDTVWEVLDDGDTRFSELRLHHEAVTEGDLVGLLRNQVASTLVELSHRRSPQEIFIEQAVSERFAALPAIPSAQAPPGALRVVIGRQLMTPIFQLLESSDQTTGWQLRRVVEHINQRLGAETDARGAVGWWITVNPWISSAPASLLDTDREDEIAYAADQLFNDSY